MSKQSNPTPVRASFDPKHLTRLMPFKATSDIRYYLCGICIERAQKGVYVIATDGHTLGVIHDVSGTIEGADRVIVNVSSALAQAARRARPIAGIGHRVLLDGKRVRIAPSFEDDGSFELYVQPGNSVIEANFPDWRRVLPNFDNLKRGAFTDEGEANVRYIARCAEVLTKNEHLSGVVFWQESPEKVIVAQITKVPELLVLIMPHREGATDAKQRELFKPFQAPSPKATVKKSGATAQGDVEAEAPANSTAEPVPA